MLSVITARGLGDNQDNKIFGCRFFLCLVFSVSGLFSQNLHAAVEVCPKELGIFNFHDPVTEVEAGDGQGHVYRFANVLSGVDAKVTIVGTKNAKVQTIDNVSTSPNGYLEAFQPIVSATNKGTGDHYVDFKIEFVRNGTNAAYSFPAGASYIVSALDIDGIGNSSIREYVGFKGFDQYFLESSSNLNVRNAMAGGYTGFITSNGKYLPGVTISNTDHIVTTEYKEVNVFYYRAGINLKKTSNLDGRYFSLYFGCITYQDPPEPTTGKGTLRYANSGTGQYKDRILFMDWKDSSLEDGLQEGDTVEFDIPESSCMANGKLTATFSNVDDPGGIASETKPHDMKTWDGASFYQLYNTDGEGEAIYTPQIRTTSTDEHHLSFTINWDMLVNGEVVKPDLFFIDAESTTSNEEQIDAITNGGYWSVIENAVGNLYSVEGLGTQQIQITKTETAATNMQFQEAGWSPLMLTKGATETTISMRTINGHGGLEAAAFALLAPCDHGDAPESYGNAGHAFVENPISAFKTELGLKFASNTTFDALYIGATPPDSEFISQSDIEALGDDTQKDAFDTDRDDDEDGVSIPTLPLNSIQDINIAVVGNGYLQAWFDWNADGDFDDIDEQVASNVSANSGTVTLTLNVPKNATVGHSYARFRFSTEQDLASTGYAKDGEVEDYRIEITEGNVCRIDDLSSELYSTSSVSANSNYLSNTTRVYQAKFKNSDWSGQVLAYDLKTTDKDGNVKSLKWNAANKISRSNRKLFSYDSALAINRGKAFSWANLNANQKSALMASGNASLAKKRLAWVQGSAADEGSLLRARTIVLGDIIHSNLVFKGNITNYGYHNLPEGSSYASFLSTKKATRQTIFVGANDGMLHAFDASNNSEGGRELFAYIPNEIYPKLAIISDDKYGCKEPGCLKHEYLVDGTSSLGDAYFSSDSDWHSVLLGSLGKGGKAIFALDVTYPATFSASDVLWEISATQAPDINDVSIFADHMGYTLPATSVVRMKNGQWVAIVGNGYESASHQATLFIIDIETGKLIKAIATGVGTKIQPNGLSTPTAVDSNGDNIVDHIYAGDLLGNLWVFDVNDPGPANWDVKYANPLFNVAPQMITAAPQVGRNPVGGLMVYFGTGKYFDVDDNLYEGAKPAINTFYGIHDNGSPVLMSELVQQQILQEYQKNTDTDFNRRVTSNNPVDYSAKRGWYMNLLTPVDTREGERVISQALLRQGRLIFTTMTPPQNQCVWGGKSWLMEFNAVDGRRLDVIPFDANDDKEFNESDNVDYLGDSTIISGVQDTDLGVIFSSPVVISHTSRTEGKYVTGTGGKVGMFRESASRFSGRMSWRKIR